MKYIIYIIIQKFNDGFLNFSFLIRRKRVAIEKLKDNSD